MASFIDRLAFWRRTSTPEPAMPEAKSPKPREELPSVEPIGFGQEIDPMDKTSRKDVATVVHASIQAAQNRSRAARYTDFKTMDASDIGAMLTAVVDAALTGDDVGTSRGFRVESDDKRAHELLNRAKNQADLDQLAEEALYDILKYGDA